MGRHRNALAAVTYQPEPYLTRIAANRTRTIVDTWALSISWKPLDFMILAESCYMQGIHDAMDSLFQAGWTPPDSSLTRSRTTANQSAEVIKEDFNRAPDGEKE